MKKLPEKFKKDWVEALRSGQYDQAKNVLRRVEYVDSDDEGPTLGYCCLGVACVVHNPNQYISPTKELLNSHMLPNEVIEVFSQVIPVDGDFGAHNYKKSDQLQLKLADMNDGGKSFDEIATWIEENL